MRAGLAGCLAVLVAISGACGGRFVQTGDEGGGADTGTGGGTGSGATLNRGATSSMGAVGQGARGGSASVGGKAAMGGGASVGGKATGGTFGVAGMTSAGGSCACPAIDCAPGYVLVPNPNGCCAHCENACNYVMCPGIACASGYHLEQLSGQCCASCVLDDCAAQRAAYRDFRQQLFDKYSTLGCMTDTDCSIYYEKNQCAIGCGSPIPSSAISNLDANLQSYAQLNCTPSCMNPIPPCEAPIAPSCFKSHCE